MSASSKIEWTDATWNPWEGCTKVGPGCDNCYAEARNARFGGGQAINWGPGAPRRRTGASNWKLPRKWDRTPFYECTCCGWRGDASDPEYSKPTRGCIHDLVPARRRVFSASLADIFDNEVGGGWRHDALLVMCDTPNLDWLVLTKRVGNVRKMVPPEWLEPGGWPAHIRIGATICNQPEAVHNIPKLLALPCPNFLSIEPLLGPIDLECPMPGPDIDQGGGASICQPWMIQSGIDWVIVGGESGPSARPMPAEWAQGLRDQCVAAGVPFLFKQWGEWIPSGQHTAARQANGYSPIKQFAMVEGHGRQHRIGKKAAGRLLDGIEWNGVPS